MIPRTKQGDLLVSFEQARVKRLDRKFVVFVITKDAHGENPINPISPERATAGAQSGRSVSTRYFVGAVGAPFGSVSPSTRTAS